MLEHTDEGLPVDVEAIHCRPDIREEALSVLIITGGGA